MRHYGVSTTKKNRGETRNVDRIKSHFLSK